MSWPFTFVSKCRMIESLSAEEGECCELAAAEGTRTGMMSLASKAREVCERLVDTHSVLLIMPQHWAYPT